MGKTDGKKLGRAGKFFLVLLCVVIALCLLWAGFSLIGRVGAASVIPETAPVRISVHNPLRLLEGIASHEPLPEIIAGAQTEARTFIALLRDGPLLKNPLIRLALRGNLEAALLDDTLSNGPLLAAWDTGLFSPVTRILPLLAGFVSVPNLYYVQAGKNSRFEYRAGEKTLYIGPYRNLLIITDSAELFESRGSAAGDNSGEGGKYGVIRPSSYDAAMLLAPDFLKRLLAAQDPAMAAILDNIDFPEAVEAGVSVSPKKLELRLAAPLTSHQAGLSRLIEQRSQTPGLAERLPASSQYSTILSAGSLEELYAAALVFSGPDLEAAMKKADSSARTLLGLSLEDILFSWTGKEFAVFGMEGRPNPVYAIQIADERKRQEIFNRAFKSIVLNEDARLNLDGTRIPRIEIPDFLQALLEHWNLRLPSPYYTVHNGYLLAGESAEALLAAQRAMQKNDILPKTDTWRNIAGGKAASSAFSVYYSLDRSMPFFLRGNTAFSDFLGIYRQGLLRVNFDRGQADISLTVIPGFGSGVTFAGAFQLDIGAAPSNRVYGAGTGADSRIFLSSGDSAISIDPAAGSVRQFPGQGQVWVIPAEGTKAAGPAAAWVVNALGRVTLVNGDMEALDGFPVLTGQRLSSPPAAHGGKVYLCDESGKVHTVDENGGLGVWDGSFTTALRSPPSFLTIPSRQADRTFAAVYPKSFFGEIWLLDSGGRVLPGWPLPAAREDAAGIAFGSPLLFAHNDSAHVAFVTQEGELSVYAENAVLLPEFPLTLDGIFYLQPIFDGEYLWLAGSDGVLFRVSLAGEILSQQIPGFEVREEGYITFFDCNGDKVPEIFITGEGNALHGYSRNFRSLEGFPLPVWGRPLFADFGGGQIECIGLGMDRKLYHWRFRQER